MKLKYNGKKDHKVIRYGKQHLMLKKGDTSPELSQEDISWNVARHEGLEIIGGELKKKEKPKSKNMPKKGKDKKAKEVEQPIFEEKKDDVSSDMEAALAAQELGE